ncbi:tyrosine-type recombinase/integrase [Sphingomonas sp. ASV193]|uniref:tyrosine-type recombinase/integrase n=1 Tax=Sphingomonas sp. ASV193 TaxID=3144405 RepID=UPI0032E90044
MELQKRQHREPLTDETIAGIPIPEEGYVEFSDCNVPGLRLRVKSTGIKTFSIRLREDRRAYSVVVGEYDVNEFPLSKARACARSIVDRRRMSVSSAKTGINNETFNSLLPRYLNAKQSLRSIAEIERLFFHHILPVFGQRVPWEVRRSEITALSDGIESVRVSRAVIAQLSAFYSWLLPRFDELAANPCIGAGKPPVPKPRDRVLSDEELVCLWRASELDQGTIALGVRLLILTLQRRGEVFGALRSELNLSEATWTLPSERTKNKRVHEVPLASTAQTLFAQQLEISVSERIFPSRGNGERTVSGFSKAWRRLCERTEGLLGRAVPSFTIHDLRRTGATRLQQLGVALPVTEAVLNHVSGSREGIVGVYQRYSYSAEKREALKLWDEKVRSLIG